MDNKKLLIGTVVGGISYFVLGFLIYGLALTDTMAAYSNPACMRADADMIWWAMIVGNLSFAAVLTYVFLKSNVNSFGGGAQMGALLAFLFSLSVDLMLFSTTTTMTSTTGIAIDVVAATVMGTVAGGVIGMVIGKSGQAA